MHNEYEKINNSACLKKLTSPEHEIRQARRPTDFVRACSGATLVNHIIHLSKVCIRYMYKDSKTDRVKFISRCYIDRVAGQDLRLLRFITKSVCGPRRIY